MVPAYVPPEQFAHMPEIPYFPVAHFTQEVKETVDVWPAGQDVQVVDCAIDENCPAGHWLQALAFERENVPART